MYEDSEVAGIVLHGTDGGDVDGIIVHDGTDDLAMAALDAIQPCL
jgi:hypothetical protein